MDANCASEIIKTFLPEMEQMREDITAAMNYSVINGGKRVRPILMDLAYRICGGKEDIIKPFMAALEMIHCFSLVHDDLPAMDNDTLRRGLPTTWSKYGEAGGILAGDGLAIYAFETCLNSYKDYKDKADEIIRASYVLANKAGVYGMIGGQSLDVKLEGKAVNIDQLEFIHKNKTCALLEAPFVIGAILAGKDEKFFGDLGFNLGMAFQIQDDYLDVVGDEAVLGKPINSDEKNNKMTYASVYGLDKTKEMYISYYNKCIDIVSKIDGDEEYKNELIALIKGLSSRNN